MTSAMNRTSPLLRNWIFQLASIWEEGPPGAAYLAYPNYRAALTSPFQLEKVLIRHPKLRLYAMHYASPLVDEMIAMLYSHPQLYVDVAQNDWGFPRAHFYNQLKRLIDAGFEKRIM